MWNTPRKPTIDEINYCGCAAIEGRPYCPAHEAQAHGKVFVEPTLEPSSDDRYLVDVDADDGAAEGVSVA